MEISGYSLFDKRAAKALSNVRLYGTGNPAMQNTLRVFVILVVLVLSLYFSSTSKSGYVIAPYFLGACLAFFILIPVFHILLPIIVYRNMPKDKGIKNSYIFYEKNFFGSSNSKNMQGEVRIKYEMLHKVRETKTHFLLYPSRNMAYVVDKSTMSEDGALTLRRTLQEATGRKYAICKH